MPTSNPAGKYRHPEVVARYDECRFQTLRGRFRNWRKMKAVAKALRLAGEPGLVLDIPCGTGRFFEFLGARKLRFLGADVSEPMLCLASEKLNGAPCAGLVGADAASLPFRDGAFDTVLCIRFLFHLSSDQRVAAMREMARVSKRYLILDYRLRLSLKNLSRMVLAAFGLKRPLCRPAKRQMLAEIADAGLEPVAVFRVAPIFSDKHIVLCRKTK